ncbi:serine/threonine-protein kinase mos-like [Gigantopelta aegis]|uniref:serine/threonine-protein kinase mos-like n=1 Tax=Gigantopelta aegis TaxID=1735272 RepID=UPI001B889AE6|nr:serine/threonine-protein kinase mos-like [Gigantopelta aegis]
MVAGEKLRRSLASRQSYKTPPDPPLKRRRTINSLTRDNLLRYCSPEVRRNSSFCSPSKSNVTSPFINSPNVPNLSKEDVQLGTLLGFGGFGSVFHGVYKKRVVAVKILHKIGKNKTAQFQSYKAELRILYFKSPYVVKSLNATPLDRYDEGAWVVMEFVGHRNLQQLLNDPDEHMDQSRRLKFALQIAQALHYAHTNCVVHLDLKPANIFLTGNDDIKLGDFGCCQQIDLETGIPSPLDERSNLTGTFAYRAPELLKGHAPTTQADIYSFGITSWQMFARENPYGDQNQHMVIFCVVSQNLRPSLPDVKDDPFESMYQDLYTQCWRALPEDRPTSGDLLNILKLSKTMGISSSYQQLHDKQTNSCLTDIHLYLYYSVMACCTE